MRDSVGRGLLVIFLFAAAGAYLGFVIGTGASPAWALLELLQVVGFGTLALLGWRGSAYWLAGGWALHSVWDVGLHYVGPGSAFTPVVWAVSCIPFDLLVAAYVVIAYQLIGARTLRLRDVRVPQANPVGR